MYVDRGGRTLKLKKDEVIPIDEIASMLGINATTIIDRYNSGWSLAAALTNGRIRRFKTKRA